MRSEHAFEKFATAEKQGGTGLGVYSAKLIAKTLGSTMGFETSEETGTTMSVTLPLAKFAPPTAPISSE